MAWAGNAHRTIYGNDDPKPEDLFGARYAFESVEELFSDKDVAVAVDTEADSQEGLSELA